MLTLYGGMVVKLKKHQELPIKFMKNNHGLILYHSTGSGKTLTGLFSMYQFDKDIIIIGPKSSKKSFNDNILKAGLDPTRVTFYTFTKIKEILLDELGKPDESNTNKVSKMFKNKSVIVDEAHNLRNEKGLNVILNESLKLSYKIIMLSATAVINYFNDLSVLINIAKNNNDLPITRDTFNPKFFENGTYKLINKEYLENKMRNCISYYKQGESDDYLDDYPTSKTNYIKIEMSNDQLKQYIYYIQKILNDDEELSESISDLGITPYVDFKILNKKKKNLFMSVTRQISNCVDGEESPKIDAIFNKLKKGPFPVIVYSNFKKNGIYAIANILNKHKFSYGEITGESNDNDITDIVNNYNNGKYKVLLITAAGSESLDLKNTRQVHIMEPYWNEARIDQVVGRAIRYKSHIDLPKKDQNVTIYRWISIFPDNLDIESADEHLMMINERKRIVYEKFINIVIKASIENDPKYKKLRGGSYDNGYIKYINMYKRLKNESNT